MPPGLLKSGIDAATETPAPVSTQMLLHLSERINLAKPAISTGAILMGFSAFLGDEIGV